MLEVREVPGKGRGVFASRSIKSGEVVLSELPLLLFPQHSTSAAFCSHCLRAFNSLDSNAASVVPCSSCGRVGFCSTACAAAAAADPGSHCPGMCRLLAACNMEGLTDEQQSALQFLARCCSLRAAAAAGDSGAAARCTALTSLATAPVPAGSAGKSSGSGSGTTTAVRELHGRLSHALAAASMVPAAALSLDEAAGLLQRDAANGYGIMAPSAADGERRIRGTGLYATASMFNHECLPNVARFDCFDHAAPAGAPPGANTAVEFRAMHDIPAGEEVTQSYFPLPWPFTERQQRCREDYGFECACPRCKEEATWTESEGEWETDDGEDAGMEEDTADGGGAMACSHAHDRQAAAAQQQQAGQQAAACEAQADPAYINLFLLKYVCPREGCYGTLAPLGPATADMYECNMCGARRTEADFLAELEAAD